MAKMATDEYSILNKRIDDVLDLIMDMCAARAQYAESSIDHSISKAKGFLQYSENLGELDQQLKYLYARAQKLKKDKEEFKIAT